MRRLIYLDESGDLGWKFDHPYQHGGSSRKLTISAVSCPEAKVNHLRRIVRGLYKKRKRPIRHELKSVNLGAGDRTHFIRELERLRRDHADIRFFSITTDKQRVQETLRADANKLYTFMVRHLLLDELCANRFVDLIPDARSEKVNTGWNLGHYLAQMIYERRVSTAVINESCHVTPMESHHHLELQFVDYYTALVWAKYEYAQPHFDDFLGGPQVQDMRLFFP